MCGWSHVDKMCSWVSRDEQQCMMGECLDLCLPEESAAASASGPRGSCCNRENLYLRENCLAFNTFFVREGTRVSHIAVILFTI